VAESALDFDASAVNLRDVFNNGETKTRPTLLAASSFINAVEAFEETFDMFVFNPVALIFYGKNRFARFRGR